MARLRRTSKRQAEIQLADVLFPLMIGPIIKHRFPDFDDVRTEWERQRVYAELRPAWFKFRAEILEMAPAGQRPWAFWEYEQAGSHPDNAGDSAKRLAAMGELSDAEAAAVKSWEALSHPLARPRSDAGPIPAHMARSSRIAPNTEGRRRQ